MPLAGRCRPRLGRESAETKNGAAEPRFYCLAASDGDQTENDEPQPQVVVAFGFLITNCAPFRSSL